MGHFHTNDTFAMSDARLLTAVAVNGLLTVVQGVGGLLSGSLSLVADALHNLSDAGALLIAWVARRIGRRPADRFQTFGYRRVELVGALINSTTLNIVGLYLVYEAVTRLVDPPPVAGWTVVIVAGVAFVIDVITALLTYSMAKGSLNVRAAFVHNVTDALGSVAVVVAGILILRYQLYLADVVATFLIAGYALYQGMVITREASRILTLGVPSDVYVPALVDALRAVDGVADVHHLHVWRRTSTSRSGRSRRTSWSNARMRCLRSGSSDSSGWCSSVTASRTRRSSASTAPSTTGAPRARW